MPVLQESDHRRLLSTQKAALDYAPVCAEIHGLLSAFYPFLHSNGIIYAWIALLEKESTLFFHNLEVHILTTPAEASSL
jgi:hypothetical protein